LVLGSPGTGGWLATFDRPAMDAVMNDGRQAIMPNEFILQSVEKKIITLRNEKVILDSSVAELYGVETRDINKTVKNNPNKFPAGYIFQLDEDEWKSSKSNDSTSNLDNSLRWKNSTLKNGRGEHTKYPPKAFTEKGLYMLATILKSKQATATTLAIVEAFAKLWELWLLPNLQKRRTGTRKNHSWNEAAKLCPNCSTTDSKNPTRKHRLKSIWQS
jgi:phage regulator Rha-like protein